MNPSLKVRIHIARAWWHWLRVTQKMDRIQAIKAIFASRKKSPEPLQGFAEFREKHGKDLPT